MLLRPSHTAPLTTHTEWKNKNREARAQIILSLKDEPLDTIIKAETVAECWEKLLECYEGRGVQRKMQLLDEIFKTTFTDLDPLKPQINSLLQSAHMVWNLGVRLGDDIITAATISALPSSLSTLKTVLANSTKEPSPSELKAQILADEQHRICKSGIGVTAFFVKTSKKSKESKEKEKEKAKKHCTHCDIRGHDINECWKFKKEQEVDGTAKTQTPSAPTPSNPKATKDSTATSANVAMALSMTEPVVRLFTALALVGGISTLLVTPLVNIKYEWITDSGVSCTMCSNQSWFTQYTPLNPPIDVALGDNSTIPTIGVGRVHTCMHTEGKWNDVIIQDILFVPDLHGNLLSVVQLTSWGAEIHFRDHFCRIFQNKELTCEGMRQGDLYIMDTKMVGIAKAYITEVSELPDEGDETRTNAPTSFTGSTSSKAMLGTWHQRLGHLHSEAVLHMARKGMVKGMEIHSDHMNIKTCEACLDGKQTQTEIQKTTDTQSDEVLGQLFSDVCRKLPTVSCQGYSYFITFTDDCSRKVFVARLWEKSEVFQCFMELLVWLELQMGYKLKAFRTDGEGKYMSKHFESYLKTKGIHHEITMPNTPQHNGVAEWLNRTLMEKVRMMLSDAKLPEPYWFDALEYAIILWNVLPTRALTDVTPEEAWSGNKPDVSHLRIFSCQAFMHIPKESWGKLTSKSLLCTFLGYTHNHSAYRLIHWPSHHLFESWDVIFDEFGQ
jgi:Pol polyprotein/LTR polyprotein gag-polypeptide-like protein/gag-pre-integrase-like protein/integrase-like protein